MAPDYDRLNHILSLNIDKGCSHLLWNSSCDAYVFPPYRLPVWQDCCQSPDFLPAVHVGFAVLVRENHYQYGVLSSFSFHLRNALNASERIKCSHLIERSS